jgi:uncharacterized membrane protein YdjX (TVP38/TMEM64 family)
VNRRWIRISIVVLIVVAAVLSRLLLGEQYLDVHHLKQHREQLISFITNHYIEALLGFVLLYIGSALFLPGALALTIAGGMVFGVLPTVFFANVGATTGAVLAFLISRFVIGGWFQERFSEQLHRFNNEMSRHGPNYMLTLRIIPVAPFFVINYCAGLTKIPIRTFAWTTSLGMLPGSFAYAYVGHQLRHVNALADLLSWKIVVALLLLGLFAALPVILHHLPAYRK